MKHTVPKRSSSVSQVTELISSRATNVDNNYLTQRCENQEHEKTRKKCVQPTHVASESVAGNWAENMTGDELRRQQREQRQFQRRSGQFVACDETSSLCFLLRYRRHSDSDQQQQAAKVASTTTAAAIAAAAAAGATSATVKLRRLVERQQRPQSTAFETSNVWAITIITITKHYKNNKNLSSYL